MLAVDRISKAFGGVQALHNVSFDVPEGAIFGIMGANGAGKTTLFSIIAGNQSPTTGEVRLRDRRLTGLPSYRVAQAGIARTFQIVRPFRGLSVRDNIRTGFQFGVRNRTAPTGLEPSTLFDLTGLTEIADRPAGDLTLSQQKRLEVARAMATEPTVLLLDEVMAGLTATEVQDMIAMVRRIRDSMGVTVMIIEHVMGALMTLSDHIVVLDHGEKIAEGAPKEIAENRDVQSAYLGRDH